MIPIKKSRILALAAAFLLLPFAVAPRANATISSGITISPAELKLTLDKDYPVITSSIGIRNESENTTIVRAEASDVTQIGGSFLLSQSSDDSMLRYVELPVKEVKLQPEGSVNIAVKVTDNDKLGPGSHYFAVVFSQVFDDADKVQLSPAIQVLVEVVKETGAVRQVDASFVGLKRVGFSIPKSLDMVIKNTGNTTVIPRASVEIMRGGEVAAKGVINENSVPLLSGLDTRQRSFITKVSRLPGIGRVKVLAKVRIDGQDQIKQVETSFIYIPKATVIVVILLFAFSYWLARKLRRKQAKARSSTAPVELAPKETLLDGNEKTQPLPTAQKAIKIQVRETTTPKRGGRATPVITKKPKSRAKKVTKKTKK